MLLSTDTALKVAERATRVHDNHARKVWGPVDDAADSGKAADISGWSPLTPRVLHNKV